MVANIVQKGETQKRNPLIVTETAMEPPIRDDAGTRAKCSPEPLRLTWVSDHSRTFRTWAILILGCITPDPSACLAKLRSSAAVPFRTTQLQRFFYVRQGLYLFSILCVVLWSEYPTVLASVLLGVLVCVHRHSHVSTAFIVACSVGFPLVEGVAIRFSSHTWTYVHPLPVLRVPLWLFPLWGCASVWVLDVYTICM